MLADGVGAVALALVAGPAAAAATAAARSGTPVKGGMAVIAEPPSHTPNYILPFMTAAESSNVNLFDFTYLMYRPLYWFGVGSQPVFNPLPQPGQRARLQRPERDDQPQALHVVERDAGDRAGRHVLDQHDEGGTADWFDFTPGGFPANVSNIKAVSSTELTMTLNKAYSPTWFQYNELSQITPMPAAWDRTASGPSNCDTTVSDCAAVYNYLAGQAKDLTTYATSPVWGIVDGPWKLSAFNADGHMTFVPNKSYSGPIKPKLAAFQEVPFTTDAAEYDVMQSPNSSTKIDYGYLPRGRPGQAGQRCRRYQPAGLEGLHAGPAVHLGL